MNKHCRAYQASDQMTCSCGLAWDVNDPEPPECRSGSVAQQELAAIRAVLIEPSRFAGTQRKLLKIAEMPLRWLPTANIEAGLYTVHWGSLPGVVFVLVDNMDAGIGHAKHYRFFNERGRLELEVRRRDQGMAQFELRYANGSWINEQQ